MELGLSAKGTQFPRRHHEACLRACRDHQPDGQFLQAHQRAAHDFGRDLGAEFGDLDRQQPHPHGARAGPGRFELRLPDGAANPYLLQAVIIAAGLDGIRSKADPGKRYDIDMYSQGHTVKGAPKLPLNLLDALREFDKDKSLKAALGEEFSSAYLKLKHQEWNSYASHFTQWERDHTLDI